MNDPNRMMKWLLIIGMVVVALATLYPPSEKLKGGIDLVGGASMLLEIDTTGLEPRQLSGLSTKVMNILKDRVDPKGQLNLEWRPVGNTRLEIRMPRPPREAIERREAYDASLKLLEDMNLSRFAIEEAMESKEADRDAKIDGLRRGVAKREALLVRLVVAEDARISAEESKDETKITEANATKQQVITELLTTSLPITRFTDTLAMGTGSKRAGELTALRERYPSYDAGNAEDADGKLLSKAVTAYDAWSADKADLEDPEDLKRRIRGAGVLEFRILADRDPSSPRFTRAPKDPGLRQPIDRYIEQLGKYGPRAQAGDRFAWYEIEDARKFLRASRTRTLETILSEQVGPVVSEYAGKYFVLIHSDPNYAMTKSSGTKKWSLRAAFPDRNPQTGGNVVSFVLDARGGALFRILTGSNVNRQLTIMLDNKAVSSANINEAIGERCQISGDFTVEKVQELVRTLDAGSLPARLKETPLQEKNIGPSLGATNRRKGIQAATWGAVSVALFVLVYYGLAGGGMANVALALNMLFVLSMMAIMQATFTLPGIAGLILTVGMAIDANVLIFERIREERERGVIFKKALNTGYDKAFSTIIDANLTTLIICVILGFVGSEEVKGFAIVLGIGITTSMFTSLFVTRLAFNTLIAGGLLKDLRMMRMFHRPTFNWLAMRRIFWPVSTALVILGVGGFVGLSAVNKEAVYDIEFLGGTSVTIDLKPGVWQTAGKADVGADEKMTAAITGEKDSATSWLLDAAGWLGTAKGSAGNSPGQFVLTSSDLTGEQLGVLMRETLSDRIERDGIVTMGSSATFEAKPNQLSLESFRAAVVDAASATEHAADQMRKARTQEVSDIEEGKEAGLSFDIVTTETNRQLVQAAILATLGDKLQVQQSIPFTPTIDEEITRRPFFVVESGDEFLSDVIGGDSNFGIRKFRGGVAIEVVLDDAGVAISKKELERRLREIALQPEFERFHSREFKVYPLGGSVTQDDETVYRRFAVLAVDDAIPYDQDALQWTAQLAEPQLVKVSAALERQKSLSKIIQFAPQVAGQTTNKAIFSIALALAAIISYLWFRFGNKEFGLAAIVALIHDVSITLGLVAISHFIYASFLGKALMIEDFKVDLPMIAAILTVIGYSLNDTIVVFDRIRENRGKVGSLTDNLVNNSINQCLSRTVLTSVTTFLVVAVLYIFGGKGVHGFSFALLIGVVVGTYSSIAIATPLLLRPQLLRNIVIVMFGLGLIGITLLSVETPWLRWGVAAGLAIGSVVMMVRQAPGAVTGGRVARA